MTTTGAPRPVAPPQPTCFVPSLPLRRPRRRALVSAPPPLHQPPTSPPRHHHARRARFCTRATAAATSASASPPSSSSSPSPSSSSSPSSGGAAIAPLVDPAEFPILAQRVHDDKPLVYLDSAATSQKPRRVIDALSGYYEATNSNVHRGAHALAARATDDFEATRRLVAQLLNAASPSEVVFTRNATEAINLVASTWARANLSAGDTVLVSTMDHHANIVSWQLAARAAGASVAAVPLLPGTHAYDVDALRALLARHTVKLVALPHVSNVLGCVNPVADVVALARAHGAAVLVDACQSVPHMPVDVQALGADFVVASGHKMCGPTGAGFLWGRADVLETMPPYMGGGEMIADVWIEQSTFAAPPHRFEAGTPAIGEVVALGEAVRFLQELDLQRVHQFELSIAEYLYNRLSEFEEVDIYGPPPPRAALCAFNVRGVHSSDLATMLDLDGVAIRSGHHCAQPLHRALDIPSSARASLYIYNSTDEVDALIESLKSGVDLLGGTLTPRKTASAPTS